MKLMVCARVAHFLLETTTIGLSMYKPRHTHVPPSVVVFMLGSPCEGNGLVMCVVPRAIFPIIDMASGVESLTHHVFIHSNLNCPSMPLLNFFYRLSRLWLCFVDSQIANDFIMG